MSAETLQNLRLAHKLPRNTPREEVYFRDVHDRLLNLHIFSLMREEAAQASWRRYAELAIRRSAWAQAEWRKSPEGQRIAREALERQVLEEARKIGDNFPKPPSTLLVSFSPLPAPTDGKTLQKSGFSVRESLLELWREIRS